MAVEGSSYREADAPPLPGLAEYHDGSATESDASASGRRQGSSAPIGNRRARPENVRVDNGSHLHSNMHDDRLPQHSSADSEEFPELLASQRPRPSLVVPNSLRAALKGVAMDRAKAGHPTSRLRNESPDVTPKAPVPRGANTMPSPSASQALQNLGAQTAPKYLRIEPQPSKIPQANGNSLDSFEHGENYRNGPSQGSRLGSAGGAQQILEQKSSRNMETHPEFEGAYFEIDGERYEYEDDGSTDNRGGAWLQQQYEHAEEFEQYGGDDYEQEQLENELFEREQAVQYGGEQDEGRQWYEEKQPVARQLTPAEKKVEANLRRMAQVVSSREMVCFEMIKGMRVNILEGLELHKNVFTPTEQQKLVDLVYEQQELGRQGLLKGEEKGGQSGWVEALMRIHSAWFEYRADVLRASQVDEREGAGDHPVRLLVTPPPPHPDGGMAGWHVRWGGVLCGSSYNYAVDKEGNPPGIARQVAVDPFPERLKQTIARLVMWHILPPHCTPDSCIINIYEKDDCIPPHIDHHDFVRPFCTLSLLCTAPILFGSKLDIAGPGEFKGTTHLTLPPGSVLVLAGNGADVAKHCIPAVPEKRISITFRKMDRSKHPCDFKPEADLQSIVPLTRAPLPPPPPIVNAWGAGPPKPRVALSAGAPSFVPGAVIPPPRTSWADEAGS